MVVCSVLARNLQRTVSLSSAVNAWADDIKAMKYAIAAIYTNYISHCVNADVRTPIEKDKRSTIGERHPLLLRFELVKG